VFGKVWSQKLNFLPDTTGGCRGDSVVIDLKVPNIERATSVQWITPNYIVYNTNRYKTSTAGKHIVKLTINKQTYVDSTYIKFHYKPYVNLRDTQICGSGYLVLDAKNPGLKYTWNTDETLQRIKVDNSGKYWVKINNKGCTYSDTVKVTFQPGVNPSFGNEVQYCLTDENKPLSIKAPVGTRVLWSTGSTNNSINATKEGVYWVRTEQKNCGVRTDSVRVKLKACDCEILVPNSFTPNDDDRNDYFYPVLQCDYSYYSMSIFDRWGNTIYSTNNVQGKWDGRFKGNLCPDDIYVYKIETTERGNDKKVVRNGHISLFR
jgi:gliding motility-associated-like protein